MGKGYAQGAPMRSQRLHEGSAESQRRFAVTQVVHAVLRRLLLGGAIVGVSCLSSRGASGLRSEAEEDALIEGIVETA